MFLMLRFVYTTSDHLADIENHCVYSYHSHKALQMMNKYRIGRIDGDWVNFTPPIRGGSFRDTMEAAQEAPDGEDSEDDSSSWSSRLESTNSSTTSIDSITSGDICSSVARKSSSTEGLDLYFSSVHQDRARERRDQSLNHQSNDHQRLSPNDYTSSVIQKAIDDNVRDYPSLDAETQSAITLKYQVLHQRVKDEGFYDCHYIEYGKEIIRYTLLFSLFLTSLRSEWYMTSACFLGLFWVSSLSHLTALNMLIRQQHQIMFTAHDAGHRGITHNFVADTMIGIFIADLCCGLSIGWWKSSHNVHHLVTNHPVCDSTPANNILLIRAGT